MQQLQLADNGVRVVEDWTAIKSQRSVAVLLLDIGKSIGKPLDAGGPQQAVTNGSKTIRIAEPTPSRSNKSTVVLG